MICRPYGLPLLALLSAMAASLCGCGKKDPEARLKRFSIVVTGFSRANMDVYEKRYSRGRKRYFGGMLHCAGLVRSILADEKKEGFEPVLIDLGDHLSGTAQAYVSKGAIVTAVMNTLPYTASLLGNREFNFGQDELAKRAKEAKFPYVATNLLGPDEAPLPYAKPYVLHDVAGLKLAFIGLVPPNLKTLCLTEHVRGLRVRKGLTALEETSKALAKKADLVLALTQADLGYDVSWLIYGLRSSSIDILLGLNYRRHGGMVSFGKTVTYGLRSNNQGAQALVVRVWYDPEAKRLVRTQGESRMAHLSSPADKPDPRAAAAAQVFRKSFKERLSQAVGTIEGEDLEVKYRQECALGDLVADTLRKATGADCAIVNSGSVGGREVKAGPLTVEDLFRIYAYDNAMIVIEVSGGALQEALRQRLADGFFYQVSGLRYSYRPKGKWKAELVGLEIGGQPVQPARLYRVALNSFAYQRINGLHGAKVVGRHGMVRRALAEVIKSDSPMRLRLDGRIRVLPPAAERETGNE